VRIPWTLVAAALAFATVARAQDEEAEPTPAPAERAPAEAAVVASTDLVVGVAGRTPDQARVVTSSGRVYGRGPDGTWTRLSAGGVGTPLVAARAFASGDVWAVGATPPAFRFAGATWGAAPVRRSGAAHLGACAAPSLASGRRVFVHDGKRWKELRRVPGSAALVTLCLVDATHGAALLDDGSVQALAGGWRPLVLAGGARATWLGGGATPLVATDRGEVYRLDAGKPVRLVADAPVVPCAAAATPRHTFLLTDTAVLRLDGRKLVRVDALPGDLGAHEWMALLAADDGTLTIVARDGSVARRTAAGAWSKEAASAAPVAEAARATNPPARVGP
jgi:hypothetical protein